MNIDIKRLKDLYVKQKLSIAETAESLGISYSTVWKVLKQEGIPLRSRSKLDADELRRLYEGKGWTPKQIAKHFGVSRQLVYDKLQRLGVELRPPEPPLMTLDVAKVRELYVDRGLSLRETSRALGVTPGSVRRLMIREGIPRRRPGKYRQ